MEFENFDDYKKYIEKNPIGKTKKIKTFDNLNDFLCALYNNYIKASNYMSILDDIKYVSKNKEQFYREANGFFNSCRYATIDALIVIFYKIIHDGQSNGDIYDFLDFIELKIYEHCLINMPHFSIKIINDIHAIRMEIKNKKSVIKRINITRNNIVAHNGKIDTIEDKNKFVLGDYEKLFELLEKCVGFTHDFFFDEQIKKSKIIDTTFDYSVFNILSYNSYWGKPLKYYYENISKEEK